MMRHFNPQTRDKLSSIFSASEGDHKVAFKGFIRTRSVWAYVKLVQGFDLFRTEGLRKTIKKPYNLQNKEVDRFHAALSPNNYREET